MITNILITVLCIIASVAMIVLIAYIVYSRKARKIGVFVSICSFLLVLMIMSGCSQYSCPTYASAKPLKLKSGYNTKKPVSFAEYREKAHNPAKKVFFGVQ